MAGTLPSFALTELAYPSESLDDGFKARPTARRVGHADAWEAEIRARPVWRGSGEAIFVAAIGR